MRFAPSLDVIGKLLERRVQVRAFDPVAMPKAKALLPRARLVKDPYEAARGADALVIVTEWPEFAGLDLARLRRGMKTPILLDGRNIYDPAKARAAGFTYRGVGRP
jgi:UDPglucose 6-dehydrogenase